MSSALTTIAIVAAVLLAVTWVAALALVRPRVAPDRRAAAGFAAPAVAVGLVALTLSLIGLAAASPALWCVAGILAAASVCFIGRDRVDWLRFEADFWAHVARQQQAP